MAIFYDRYGNIRYGGGISYPEAYKVPKGTDPDDVDKLKPPIEKAKTYRASKRPDTKQYQFLCPGCLAPMHWVVGAQKTKQGKRQTAQPNYGDPFFRHNPKTLNQHLSRSAPVLVADLAVVIDNIANARGWVYENLETYSTTARRIALTNNDLENPLRMEFVIAPNRTVQIPDDFDGVVITTSGRMTQNHKSLLLIDKSLRPLTAEKLHSYLHQDANTPAAAAQMLVSGILRPENLPWAVEVQDPELMLSRSRTRFVHEPKNLITAMVNIMNDQYRFVDHADIVPDYYLPTRNRFAITEKPHVASIESLVRDYDFVLSRDFASEKLTEMSDTLSRGKNLDKYSGRGGNYQYGKADFVTFTPYTKGRDDQLVQPGAMKVLINPEPWNLPRYFNRQDWENTLVVFYEAERLHDQFKKTPHYHHLRGISSSKIINTSKLSNVLTQSREFLGSVPMFEATATLDEIGKEIEKRHHHADLLAKPKESQAQGSQKEPNIPWDVNRNFLDFETGVRQGSQDPPSRS